MARIFDAEPVCCGVCKRAATGIGYAPKQGKPILWLCDDPVCIGLGSKVFRMPKEMTQFEAFALSDAGEEAGAYLESVGKTDLAELNAEEWVTFLKTILFTFEKKMRERLLAHTAPF